MNKTDLDSNPTPPAVPLEETVEPAREHQPPSARRVFAVAIAAGVLASLLSWTVGEASADWFRPRRAAGSENPMAVQFERTELDRTTVKNAVLTYGMQGAILGALLGLAGAAARGSIRMSLLAGFAGFVLGTTLAASGAQASFTSCYRRLQGHEEELVPSVVAHACVWAPLGAAAGLAFGIGLGGRGRIARATIGGILGAGIGALLYDVVGSVAFPLSKTGDPIAATATARLLAHSMAGLMVALGAAVFAETGARAGAPR